MAQAPRASEPALRRVIRMPLLVFYGVGVTVGAGIFALIGEIVRVAGDHAPLSFLVAGAIAGATGLSYAVLASEYPRAAGEAVFVKIGLGSRLAQLVGYGVTATAVISSAVITLAFGGYLGALVPLPPVVLSLAVLLVLGAIAWLGVRESIAFAAIITVIEVGTLIVISLFSVPVLTDIPLVVGALTPPVDGASWVLIFSGSMIAFFAFIGFEDIVNMAEETVNPHRALPQAIVLTLLITVFLYLVISTIAVALPDRQGLLASGAPLAFLFESVTGYSGKPVAAVASIAMINGILIQIVMASRVIYGMANEGLAPHGLAKLDPNRMTPARAIGLVVLAIAILTVGLPLLRLAQLTSLVTLCVFILVNLSLWRIGSRFDAAPVFRRWRYWGLLGALVSAALLASEALRLIT